MYITIIFLPFLGAIFSGFFGRALGVKGVHIINVSCLLITTILAFVAYYEVVLCNSPVSVELFSWINSEHLKISWAFYFDPLTVNMLIPVLIVSLLVHVYSIGYMGEDPHQQRFFSYISLFTGLMLVLVTGNNFLVMFLGWEGVGVCSYLLVHFWYTRVAAVKSALNAMFTNRVGDYFLTLGFFAIFYTFGTLDYATVFSLAPYINTNVITFIAILLLLGAAAKSAQIGLHQWLPMAMEGPTPVSSLIHAATMVTAGVYLLIRCSPLLEQSELALTIIMITGAVTAFFAASVGLFQNDIKKVIAYSTMSQLGMMVIAVGLSQYNIALAHLVLHAMYKAGLFLAAGSVLHALGDQQDFRKFGGLVKILPVTYTVMLIASLSLAALPWLSGYYSKDLIIELAYGSYSSLGYLVYLLATIAACFTMLYSVKLLYLTFLTYANAPKGNYEKAHESPWVMTLPLIILGVLSVYLGNITRDYFMGLGSQGFGNSIFTHPNHIILIDTEFGVPTLNKLLPLILSTIFAILALYLFEKKPIWLLKFNTSNIGQNIYRFFNQRYWFELIYNRCIVKGALYIGFVTNTILDRGALELIGPRGAVAGLYKISNYFASFDSGSIARYAFVMFSGLLFMLISWIIFANPESIIIDNYTSNFIGLKSAIKYSVYYNSLIIYTSYLNLFNILFYGFFPQMRQKMRISESGILLAMDSGSAPGNNNLNTNRGSNNDKGSMGETGSRYNNTEKKDVEEKYSTVTKRRFSPDFEEDIESVKKKGSSENQTNPHDPKRVKFAEDHENSNNETENVNYKGKGKEIAHTSFEDTQYNSNKGKEVEESKGPYYDPNQPGPSNGRYYKNDGKKINDPIDSSVNLSGDGKSLPDYMINKLSEEDQISLLLVISKNEAKKKLEAIKNKYESKEKGYDEGSSPDGSSDISLSSYNSEEEEFIADKKEKDELKVAKRYSEALNINEKKADKNLDKWKNKVEEKYAYNYSDEEGELGKSLVRKHHRIQKKLDKLTNKESSELGEKELELSSKNSANSKGHDKNDSSTNPKEKDPSSEVKSKDSDVSKNVKIDSLNPNINTENITESDSPFLMKDPLFNSILEKIANIINTYNINIENGSMGGNFGNIEDGWLVPVLYDLLTNFNNLIFYSPLLIIVSIVIWYYRLLPWVKKFREYLEVRKTRKNK